MIGLQSYTCGAPWRQLEQWLPSRRVHAESEQRAVESEREHRLSRLQVSTTGMARSRTSDRGGCASRDLGLHSSLHSACPTSEKHEQAGSCRYGYARTLGPVEHGDMRTFKRLYPLIYAFDNLYAAYLKARRGRRYDGEVLWFSMRLEDELLQLYHELQSETYETGEYRTFIVCEPKRREVAALPFRDRVVHHAICNVIEPRFDQTFIAHSYACRAGKGTHAGADQITAWLRHLHRQGVEPYALQADVRSYFASVDHEALIGIMARKIACPRTFALLEGIIRGAGHDGKGIPIGNLTSQLFANIYLNELDQFVKHTLRARHYLRYMDDFVILHADKGQLRRWRYQIAAFLRERLRLSLNERTRLFPASQGIDFLGYRIWRTHRLLRKRSVRDMRRKLRRFERQYAAGEISRGRITASIQGWLGHARHADTYNLRRQLFTNFHLEGAHG
jgi:RNA-directed DNA polymerase